MTNIVCRCINWREGKCCLTAGPQLEQQEPAPEPGVPLSDLKAVYAERNALAVAFATAMQALGYRAGYGLDQDADADWPVLYVQTPAGQVSWHLPKAEAAHSRIALGVYGQPWDGHNTALKYQRLASLNPYTLRTADLRHGMRTRTDVG